MKQYKEQPQQETPEFDEQKGDNRNKFNEKQYVNERKKSRREQLEDLIDDRYWS